MSQRREPKWLMIILDCIEKRSKLRGLYKFQARIEIGHEIMTKTHKEWSPTQWDDAIDGEVSPVKELVDGTD
jgi:hypothetical protein